MTYYCATCDINLWAYMCDGGTCPLCGGGTKRSQEPGSMDADAKYKAVVLERAEKREQERLSAAFDAFMAEWDEARLSEQALEIASLPVVEPVRRA